MSLSILTSKLSFSKIESLITIAKIIFQLRVIGDLGATGHVRIVRQLDYKSEQDFVMILSLNMKELIVSSQTIHLLQLILIRRTTEPRLKWKVSRVWIVHVQVIENSNTSICIGIV